ncbi:TonB-dependent receptor [Curvibacter sp. APW13]|uniref:TonB-dependent receptor n=1 Tax=Curvibacter sp. APW13 TaxID=3077236 RepID=UPI0028DFA167|nr:TonB-dependent receptor [Curvibacter sp. APW13]MDT8992111.1 TonB-dependent receptor [Curvibacter sp. APW13]
MPLPFHPDRKSAKPRKGNAQVATQTIATGFSLLALTAHAQNTEAPGQPPQLAPVYITEKAMETQGKDSVRTTTTQIGKGTQELRDIPQSVTVVTEKLIDDRQLDTLKAVLHNTAGVTFLAAEGGEEDVRLRGFSLAQTGDIFVDGIRDPAFYDRDTFNNDRIELLRGSASMLFGRGSTGGAANQVSKKPFEVDEHQIDVTLGSYNFRRVTGDFNFLTGETSALRINVMGNTADNNGAGSSIDKRGVAVAYRWGIDETDEFMVNLYALYNNNGMNYGLPWIKPSASAAASTTTLMPVNPNSYYGMASDYNKGKAETLALQHTHRFEAGGELKSAIKFGGYDRDQRASTVRFASNTTGLNNFSDATALTRGTQLKMQDMNTLNLQSDYSNKVQALGFQHEILTGVDVSRENRRVYADTPGLSSATRTAFYTALGLAKSNTTVGAGGVGSVNEDLRVKFLNNQYEATGWGVYFQDLVQVAEHWKLLGGLRYDNMVGNYDVYNYSYSGAGTVANPHSYSKFSLSSITPYQMQVAGWSPRVGALFQPDALQSYHVSLGTSFNTSGETYSLSSANQDTPPEQSANFELGAKLDSADRRFTTRWAAFHTVKYNERNTDPTSSAVVLSGRRHASGVEFDITGRLTPKWEIYGSYMWMPNALIDVGGSGGELAGARPSLTPVHSGTVWSTYQVHSQWRVGGGLNFRSEQTPNRNPGWTVPGYVTLDLMAEYKATERHIVKANITNALDTLYADALYSGHYVPGSGRTLMLTYTAKF